MTSTGDLASGTNKNGFDEYYQLAFNLSRFVDLSQKRNLRCILNGGLRLVAWASHLPLSNR
jgi:hypothetical protein